LFKGITIGVLIGKMHGEHESSSSASWSCFRSLLVFGTIVSNLLEEGLKDFSENKVSEILAYLGDMLALWHKSCLDEGLQG
jgi:hypothetical protein